MNKTSAVFFDWDGVLINTPAVDGVPTANNSFNEVQFVPGVLDICRKLSHNEVPLYMVTNQPDISRGNVAESDVRNINSFVAEKCLLTDVAMCVHDDHDDCNCRKPKPGMLIDLACRYRLDLTHSVMIGDRWRDVDAGTAAGCRTIFLDYGYNERLKSQPDYKVSSIDEASLILNNYFELSEE